MQRVGFIPDLPRLGFQSGFSDCNHTQKEFCFARFFSASPDAMFEIGLGDSVIRLAVICPNACSRPNELIDQTVVDGTPGNLFGKPNDGFTEPRSSFRQIINLRRRLFA